MWGDSLLCLFQYLLKQSWKICIAGRKTSAFTEGCKSGFSYYHLELCPNQPLRETHGQWKASCMFSLPGTWRLRGITCVSVSSSAARGGGEQGLHQLLKASASQGRQTRSCGTDFPGLSPQATTCRPPHWALPLGPACPFSLYQKVDKIVFVLSKQVVEPELLGNC